MDSGIYTVEDARKDLDKIPNYFKQKPYHNDAMRAFLINTREMPESVVEDSGAFFIDEDIETYDLPEWMQSESLGIVHKGHITMSGRCVFPVKDPMNHIMGFIGWDPTVTPKYLDSYNYGYKAKATTFFGMEHIYDYYKSKEPVFLVEGIMCSLWLRSQGFQSLASLGSHLTPYCIAIAKRFGTRLVVIPDNDEAGESYLRQCYFQLPKAFKLMVKDGNDIDGCRHEHAAELIEDLKNVTNPSYKTKICIRR